MNHLSSLVSNSQYNNACQESLLSDDPRDYEHFPLDTTDKSKQVDANGHETMDFFTDYGVQRVSIDGDLNSDKPVLVTYHDIGINHNACFSSFVNMLRAYDPKFQYFTVVHIDAPQHHYDDEEGPSNSRTSTADSEETSVEAFDLLELCSQVEEIRSKLKINKFLAVGVGAGCNVLTYYAMNYSHRLRGLILINGIGSTPSWREWVFDKCLNMMGTSSQFLSDSLNSSLLTRYFPYFMSSETYDFFTQQFSKIDSESSLKFFRGFARRQEFTPQQLEKIKTKTLVVCGEHSRSKDETIQFQKKLPRAHTTFVLLNDAGFLLTESAPQKLCSSVDLFMQTLGLTTISLRAKFGPVQEENTI